MVINVTRPNLIVNPGKRQFILELTLHGKLLTISEILHATNPNIKLKPGEIYKFITFDNLNKQIRHLTK